MYGEYCHVAEGPYTRIENLLKESECCQVVETIPTLDLRRGGVGMPDGSQQINLSVRSVLCSKIYDTGIINRLAQAMIDVNDCFYKFNLSNRFEAMLMQYKYSNGHPGHYMWHRDGPSRGEETRKLSMSVQLTASDDYEGCDLMLFTDGIETLPIFREVGHALIFPTWTPHCITTISRGTRHSIVMWAYGPAFT